MRARRGCGAVLLGALLVTVACLVFAALAMALVLTGELPFRTPYLTGLEPDPNFPFRPTTPITLTFDQPMDPDSISASLSLDPHVPGALEWSPDFTQVTFVPDGAGYELGRTYTIRLEAGAKAGTLPRTTARSKEWSFSLQPLVDTLDPPAGADSLGPTPFLQVTFNYALDCSLTTGTFSIIPDAAGLLACADRTVTFSPTLPLVPDTTYVASLDSVYLEGDPWPRPGVYWSFTTAPPLTVEEVSPEESGYLTDLWTPFRITFSRPVGSDSAASRLSVIAQDVMPVAGQLTWEQDGASLVFQPDEPLKMASQYLIRLESGVRDELGFELVETVERTYMTPSMLDLPTPMPGSQDVALDNASRVPFTNRECGPKNLSSRRGGSDSGLLACVGPGASDV